MRKIIFNEEFIEEIRKYIVEERHSIEQACNHFTIKNDTMRRVLFENGIRPMITSQAIKKGYIYTYEDIPEEKVSKICWLYETTLMPIEHICKEVKLQNYMVQVVLNNHFSQEYRDTRKAKLYRKSKIGDKNPMAGKKGESHHNYIGLCDDGNGYYTVVKPEWYSSRKKGNRVFYHHVVMCKALGITEIPKGFCVHHIDRNPKNNDISNLALLSLSAHAKLHSVENKMQGAETIHKGVGNLYPETPNTNRCECEVSEDIVH